MITEPYPPPTARQTPTDAEVIERSGREPEMFAVLYDRHAAHIHRYVTRRLGADVADDVVADTFLDAFRQRGRYRSDRADARPWLYGIAANLVGKHRRAETRMFHAFARTGVDPVAQTYSDRVDEQVSAAAAQRRLAEAIAGLPAKYREVLLLVAWAGLSHEETAEALGIAVGTVRSRLHRARKKASEALGGQNPASISEEIGNE
ncbi:RNA polymerase sigma factor [Planotetraspora kaengkrachanensis]|uniref:DNA-directed RNA polymerase sigma-70 factor n=1 Tax=Planotetraspora kaengkrachanensis TaxID=575193 RepID=A0A8J3M6S8_9ACTN|nr:RNA polymerase sigma factor [Planotetraspora kaengkrachanensis]GIG80421.1 DNA-directed RNA polymerase sigma-70 factor [Planotetraspora kaengkrachanensis]